MLPEDVRYRLEAHPPKTKGADPEEILRSALEDRAKVEESSPLTAGSRVLDVGCGYGRLGLAFTGTGVAYTGIDVNQGRLDYARWLLPFTDCTLSHLDASNARYNPGGKERLRLPFPDHEFDAVFAISVFTHIADPKAVQEYAWEIRRVIRPGGAFLSTWLTQPLDKSDDHRAVHDWSWIRDLFSNGFSFVAGSGDGTIDSHYSLLLQKVQ